MNELLDIVDKQDQVIEQKYRSEIYEQKLSCFRVINGFLINNQKQAWIPRRTKHKKLFPLCLDASVGGHVMAGESYQQAFERELKEELNIDVLDCKYEFIAKLTPHQHTVSAFMQLYVIYTDISPEYNSEDFESANWINVMELQEKIKKGEPTKGDLPVLINVLAEFFKEV
jgi:isopentenyldiphosphate isomerase